VQVAGADLGREGVAVDQRGRGGALDLDLELGRAIALDREAVPKAVLAAEEAGGNLSWN
jgi:hypothetical protein